MIAGERVALMDFGLALRGGAREDSDLSGTPATCRPNSSLGAASMHGAISTRSGVWTYEMLTASAPGADTTWMTPAATCDRWFTTRSDARVTRKKIVNFASRPWVLRSRRPDGTNGEA